MKVLIVLALAAVASAGHLALPVALASTGSSIQSRNQDAAGNYNFAYNEQHATGGSSRAEAGNALGQVTGHYTLNVADGRQRRVNYVADALGFRAAVATNEPGTAPSAPAHAPTNVGLAAPLIAAPAIAAPAIAAAPVLATQAIAAPALGLGLGGIYGGLGGIYGGLAGVYGAPAYGLGGLYNSGLYNSGLYNSGLYNGLRNW